VRAPPLALALAALAGAAGAAEVSTPVSNPAPDPGLADVRWELAPIRWRGLLATDLRSFRADGQPARRELIESATLQATSYVYQPWFAQLAFGVTAIASQERGEQSSGGNTLGGTGLVSVFPTSRFPFQANFERTDSRSSEQFTGRDYLVQRAGVRQSYRSLGGDSNSSVAFDRSTLSSDSFGRDTVDVYNAVHSRHLGPHSLEASANRTRNFREAGEEVQFDRVFARHNYSAQGLLTAETLASYGATSQTLASQAGLKNEVVQLSTFATWRRSEDDPLFVTGGARLFQSQISDPSSDTEARSVMAHGAANYRVNPNLLVNGGGSVTQNSNGGGSVVLSSQFAGATYTPDARRFGEYLYTSNLGGNVTNQTGGEEGTRRIVTAQGTHGLNRLFEVAQSQSIGLNASQSVALSHDNNAGDLRTLSHFGSVSYRLAATDTLSGLASLSASDSRSSGYADSSFQLVNLQLSGQANLGRYSSLVANFTVQGTRQGNGEPFVVSRNGGGTYQHQRAFGVAQLRYLAIYERNDYQLNTRLQGELNAPHEQVTSSLEQRLEYRIGKLEARVSYRIAEIDGKKNALLFLRVARQIGD
jgi:hypothetical protein